MVEDDKPAPPELGEIAATDDLLDLGGFMEELGTPDPVLESLGGDLVHYRRLMRDHQVKSCWQQRQRAVVAAEWRVEPGGERPIDQAAAEDLEAQLKAIAFDRISMRMLHAQYYGYAVGECLYAWEGNRLALTDIRVRKSERFRIRRRDKQLMLLRGGRQPEEMPARKFWVVTADGDNDDDPHGLGLAHQLYWPVFLKRNGARFWAVALEKFGMPTAAGHYPPGSPDRDINRLIQSLRAIHGSSAVAFPEGFKAELLESVRKSGGDHEAFLRYWDEAIAKIVLSQTMTTDNGSSRAQATVHQDVRDDVIKGDADLLCESFNQGPARWMTAWNFPGAAAPSVWRELTEAEDLDKRAEREEVISRTTGLRPTQRHVEDIYGGEWETKPEAPSPAGRVPPKAGAEFAEPQDRDAVDDLADQVDGLADQVDGLAAPMMAELVEDIRRIVDTSPTLEEAAARLSAAFAEWTPGELEELMARSMMVAHLQGATEDG